MGSEETSEKQAVRLGEKEVSCWDITLQDLILTRFADSINYIMREYIPNPQAEEIQALGSVLSWLSESLIFNPQLKELNPPEDIPYPNTVSTIVTLIKEVQNFPVNIREAKVSCLPNSHQWQDDVRMLITSFVIELFNRAQGIAIKNPREFSSHLNLLFEVSRLVYTGMCDRRSEVIDFIISHLFNHYCIALIQRARCADPGAKDGVRRQFRGTGCPHDNIYLKRPS